MQPTLLRKSAPWPPINIYITCLMKMSLVPRLPREIHLCRCSSNAPRLPSFLKIPTKPTHLAHFCTGAESTALARRRLNVQKWSERGVLCAFWLQDLLRTTTACTFNILGAEVLCAFSLRNVLRSTMPCAFSTYELPKGRRTWGAFSFLTSKRAARHSGAQFFISHLARWLRPPLYQAYFSTLRGHKTSEKHSVSQLFYLFAPLIFVLLALSLSLSFDFFFSYFLSLSPVALTTVAASVHFAGS